MAQAVKTGSMDIGSAFDLLGKSYELVKKNWQMFVVVNIFTILYSLSTVFDSNRNTFNTSTQTTTPEWATELENATSTEITILLLIAIFVILINIFFYIMMTSLQVKAAKGKTPGFSELWADGSKYFGRFIGLCIVNAFIIGVGLLLLIVPGVIALGRLILSPFVLVNEDVSVMEAIKRSNALGKKYPGKVWAVIGVSLLVGIGTGIIGVIPVLGAIAGLVLSIAWSAIIALRYLQLKSLQP